MDFFAQIIQDFSTLPHVSLWDDVQKIFQGVASGKPNHWLLPTQACKAVGGKPEQSIFAVMAVACAHIGILLVDDMLDTDPRGEYHRIGMPASSNLACAFQASALHAISQGVQDQPSRLTAMNSFNEMFLSIAFGQSLDVKIPVDESAYWIVAQTKSSPFFGAALQVGALAGGGTLEVAEWLKKLGFLYGEMIQIHDDMHDSMETPANPDWVQGRSPLPILFASLVQHPERKRFLELRQNITEVAALQEAQEILIHCGAISYCADQLIQKFETAQKLLNGIPLLNPTPVSLLLDALIAPVYKLLDATEN